jgi:hypothetical protein
MLPLSFTSYGEEEVAMLNEIAPFQSSDLPFISPQFLIFV